MPEDPNKKNGEPEVPNVVPEGDQPEVSELDEQFDESANVDNALGEDKEEESLETAGLSEVSTSPRKNILILIAVVVIGIVIVSNLLFSDDPMAPDGGPTDTTNPDIKDTQVQLPVDTKDIEIAPPKLPDVDVGQLPAPPSLQLPDDGGVPGGPTGGVKTTTGVKLGSNLGSGPGGGSSVPGKNNPSTTPDTSGAPPPPLIIPGDPVTADPIPPIPGAEPAAPPVQATPTKTPEEEKREQERLKAPAMIFAVAPVEAKKPDPKKEEEKRPPTANSRKLGDTSRMITQGKVIDAIMETAISSDLPGSLRAIVSRDVYAESGRDILIPKGSRLVGAYNTDIKRGQGRVYILWQRVIMPDGVDVQIESNGTDKLGRSGIPGEVDNKYLEIFGNSLLFSAFGFVVASVAESVTGSTGVTQTQNANGSTTTSGTPSDFALQDGITSFGATVKGIASDLINVKPTITVDQGTPIKVFVGKDLIFEDFGNGSGSARLLE